jgi:hypothetical protein
MSSPAKFAASSCACRINTCFALTFFSLILTLSRWERVGVRGEIVFTLFKKQFD